MAIVLDYSGGRPAAATIAATRIDGQPVVGAKRYIGLPGHPKNATAAELADFDAHGLGMGLVFESSAGRWRGGRAAGVVDGAAARKHATSIRFPEDRPIDMAIDQDVVTSAEFGLVEQYLAGANGPLGGVELTGSYGEYDIQVRAARAGVSSWFWQCRAWSGTPIKYFTGRHLFQRAGQTYVGGVLCDINDVNQADWGQHNAEERDMDDEDKRRLYNVDRLVTALLTGATKVTAIKLPDGTFEDFELAFAKQLADLAGRPAVDLDEAALAPPLAAALAPLVGRVPEDQFDELIDGVSDEIDRRAATRAATPVPHA